jgi:hypothetical protein
LDPDKGKRTCTLYSDFNLPPGVTLVIDVASKQNVNIIPDMFVTDPKAKDFVQATTNL